MNDYYFEIPTLGFYISQSGDPIPGIGYYDEVICQWCGSVHQISDIIDNAKQFGYSKAFYAYNSWIDGIEPDHVPEGLMTVELPNGDFTVIVDPYVGGQVN